MEKTQFPFQHEIELEILELEILELEILELEILELKSEIGGFIL